MLRGGVKRVEDDMSQRAPERHHRQARTDDGGPDVGDQEVDQVREYSNQIERVRKASPRANIASGL